MVEEPKTNCASRSNADDDLAQPALSERPVTSWSSMQGDPRSETSDAFRPDDVTDLMFTQESIGYGTDNPSNSFAFEDIVSSDSLLWANTAMPEIDQAVSLPSTCKDWSTTQLDSMLRVNVEPSLPEFDDSKLPHIDVTGFPDIWPQHNLIAEPQSDVDSNYEFLSLSRQRGSNFQRNSPDEGQQPPSEGIYPLEELFTDKPWQVNSIDQSEMKLSRPLNEEAFDCFATDSILSEPRIHGTCSIEPPELVPPSCPEPKTRKRRRLSDSNKENVNSVRRSGACLRCRIYKEPV